MTDIYNHLEDAIIEVVKSMREEVASLEDPPSYLDFNIEVNGRVLDGDVEITFTFDGGSYSKQTKGGNLRSTLDEYLRRYGWTKANLPLCLPKVDNERTNDEIPF